MDYAKIIGSNIRYERKRRGMTIDDFARVIGMAPGFLGLIERGQRGTSMTNLVAIADFFGLTMEQLIKYDMSTGTSLNSPRPSKSEKDRRALESMISAMSDEKIQILTAMAKTLNKYDIGELVKPMKLEDI